MKREKAGNWSSAFRQYVEQSGLADDINRCMFCGKCTGICPVAAINPSYSPRQIIREVLLGNDEQILQSEEIWRCFWCANCTGNCPQEIKYPLLMLVLRYYALEHGAGKKYATLFARFVANARREAVTFQPTKAERLDRIKAMRSSIGLRPLRIVSEKGREEYQKLYEITGTDAWLADLQAKAEVPVTFSFLAGKIIPDNYPENNSEMERGG
jgi:heterodisulfide reductase subunit C